MFKLPDEPEQVVRYVLMFLPGFLVLGGVAHLTDHAPTEWAFVYIAVALSIGIHLLTQQTCRALLRRRGADAAVAPPGLFLGVLAAVSALSFALITLAVDREVMLDSVRRVLSTEKASSRDLVPFYWHQDQTQRIHDVDRRPTRLWVQCAASAPCEAYPYNVYVRVRRDEVVYEGRVERYTTDPASHGFPLALAPACRVAVDQGQERYVPVPGPAVLIFGEKIESLELKEQCASGCFRTLFPDQCQAPG